MIKSSKKWVIASISICVMLLVCMGVCTIVVDPYFHYHKPLSFLQYPIDNERYQNNGIVRYFDYDAIITGTSMTQNFRTSEFDDIFDVNSIKVPFSGATYKEINDNLKIAMESNSDIKTILRCLDYNRIICEKDAMMYDSYPTYLYDDKFYNDVEYIFNKEIWSHCLYAVTYTKNGGVTTDFDSYGRWMEYYTFGKSAVDSTYKRQEKVEEITEITEEDYDIIEGNLVQNVINLVEKYPETEFYLFFSPYSVYYWDMLNQQGRLEKQLDAEKYAIELLLQYDNIHLFSFFNNYDMICNLDNYKDIYHYSADVNSQILLWMKEGEYELTQDNYEEYCKEIKTFYTNYDYDSLFVNNELEDEARVEK